MGSPVHVKQYLKCKKKLTVQLESNCRANGTIATRHQYLDIGRTSAGKSMNTRWHYNMGLLVEGYSFKQGYDHPYYQTEKPKNQNRASDKHNPRPDQANTKTRPTTIHANAHARTWLYSATGHYKLRNPTVTNIYKADIILGQGPVTQGTLLLYGLNFTTTTQDRQIGFTYCTRATLILSHRMKKPNTKQESAIRCLTSLLNYVCKISSREGHDI